MRIPTCTPELPRPRPTLAQLRTRLANVISEGHGHLPVGGGMTLRTAIEQRIARIEVAAEDKRRSLVTPLADHFWGRVESTSTT